MTARRPSQPASLEPGLAPRCCKPGCLAPALVKRDDRPWCVFDDPGRSALVEDARRRLGDSYAALLEAAGS